MPSKNHFIALCLLVSFGCSHSKKAVDSTNHSPVTTGPSTQQGTSLQKADTQVLKEVISDSIECKRNNEVRKVEIEMMQPKGCKLWYDRLGSRSAAASSRNGKNHCEQVLNKIRSNLEAADFKCAPNSTTQPKVQPPSLPTPEPRA